MHTQSANTVKQRLHKLLSLLLAVVLVVGLVPAITPVSRADSWATPYLDKLVGWGFMRADQAADHNKAMTRAEFMAVINRAYGYDQVGEIPFTDVRPSDWFYEDVCIAYNARYMAGTSETTASPNATLTREQAVVILGHNMLLEESNGENLNFTDARNISNWSRGLVKTASDQYIINGYADGSFRPKSQVTRGEMAALICNIIGTPLQEAGEQELGDVFGNVTITSAGVKLKNTTIAGDLYISGGVDLGDVELENVEVLGRIIVGGAGESEKGKASLILRNVQADKMVVDSLKDQYITMRVEGSTVIPEVTVKTSAYLEDNTPLEYGLKTITFDADGEEPKLDLAGRVKEVINVTPDSTIQVAKGTVEKLTVDERATESTIIIDRGTNVRELNLDTGTQVNGEGDIGSLNINAPGSTVEMLPDQIYIRPGLTGNIAGTVMDSTAAEEASRDPKILAGYPNAADVAPTSVKIEVKTNKKGTVHWAITTLADGSLGADELINPPSYGSKAVQRGSISVTAADTLTTGEATGLVSDGTYYISAVLVDEQGKQSPVKSTAFTTPDDSVPAFNSGYPRMTQTKPEESWVLVMPNKTCKLYYALFPAGATAPTKENMKTGALSGNLGYGVLDVTKNIESTFQVNDRTLGELKDYVLYLWLTDANGANSSAVVPVDFTTDDVTPPFFTTLPYVTKEGANSVNLSYEVNENATVYWAVVNPPRPPYPRPEAGTTTVDLTSEYAKIQVKSGMHALASGNSKFTVGQTGTLNITGLEPETAYELYFVAQDEQGNFSVSVQHMTINTQDSTGPTVRVDFNRFVETEVGDQVIKSPQVNSDIMLIFSEGIRSEETGDVIEELYAQVLSTSGDERIKAKEKLGEVLRHCITLYEDTIPPTKVADRWEVEQGATPNAPWGIDYREAVVRMNDEGELVITFPYGTGVQLDSGVTYYFEYQDITDTSTGQNPMKKPDQYKFTTVFAQVYLERTDLARSDRPKVDQNDRPEDENNKGYVYTDLSFEMTPLATKRVGDNIYYDLIFRSSNVVTFTLYTRETGTATWTKGKQYTLSPSAGAGVVGISFSAPNFQELNKLEDEDYTYEFALSFDRVNDDPQRSKWNETVSIEVLVPAGGVGPLQNLSNTRIDDDTWKKFLEDGLNNNGGVSIGNTCILTTKLSDSAPPEFINEQPIIKPGDSFVEMSAQLDRPGTVHYIITRANITGRDTAGEITSATPTIDTKKKGETTSILYTEVPTGGDDTRIPQPELDAPGYTVVTRPAASITFKGAEAFDSMEIPIEVRGLDPESLYYVYFVLESTAGKFSPVYIYKFETSAATKPAITLQPNNPQMSASTTVDSKMHWIVFSTNENAIPSVLKQPFDITKLQEAAANSKDPNYTAAKALLDKIRPNGATENQGGTVLASQKYCILDAMLERGAGQYSAFDTWGTDVQKNAAAPIIRVTSGTGANLTDQGYIREFEGGVENTKLIDVKGMTRPTRYYFVAVARHVKSSDDALPKDVDSFSAAKDLYVPDNDPPTLLGVSTATDDWNNDLYNPRFTGTVSVSFNEPIYASVRDPDTNTVVRKKIVFAKPTADDEVYILDIIDTSASTDTTATSNKLEVVASASTQSIKFKFTNISSGCYIQFFNGAYICDVDSNATEKFLKLTYRAKFGESIVNPDWKVPELEECKFEWEWVNG